jgi:hypothetical protein
MKTNNEMKGYFNMSSQKLSKDHPQYDYIMSVIHIPTILDDTELVESAKNDFKLKRALMNGLIAEVKSVEERLAKDQIKNIVKMYMHIDKSKKVHGIDIPQLRHYGFPEGTEHHIQYRKKRLSTQEYRDMPWKYTDKNPKSLKKQLAMCDYYYANIDHTDVNVAISKEHLMELVNIASKYS